MELYDAYSKFPSLLLSYMLLHQKLSNPLISYYFTPIPMTPQVPIVASTGGLVDTVKEGFTGFQMGSFNVEVITCFLSHAS